MLGKIKTLFTKVKDWFLGLGGRPKAYLAVGVGMTGAGAVVGGVVGTAVVGALIINTLLWMMLNESEFAMGMMRKWGGKVDLTITLLGLVTGGGITGWLTAAMVGAYFSVFRNLFCPPGEESDKNEEEATPRWWSLFKKKEKEVSDGAAV